MRASRASFTAGSTAANLPLALTSFIGRANEIAEVRRLLTGTRLLTLTGAGGCGKTRLALEVAGALRPEYPDGVWFVELAAIGDAGAVPDTIASSLGIQERSGQTVADALVAALRTKMLLLVLDNCEHLVPACGTLAETLLRGCPRLRLLATSRAPLGVPGRS